MTKAISYIANGTPWAIEKGALETIISVAQRENNLEAVLKERGEPLDNTHKVDERNGVALIPVTGALFPRANLFSQVSGAYSVEMLARDLAATEADPTIAAAVLMIDSPGGHTTMINEFANQVKAYSKPIVAYVVGNASSAAYWIASAADKIVMDATAMVGSVGVVAAFSKDDNKTIEIVSSNAQDKRPDLNTDEGRGVVQAIVDDMESVFIGAVSEFRGMARDQITALRGGVLIGAKAVEAGFADEVGSLECVISSLTYREGPMDLQTLKADHPALYQAVFDQGVASVDQTALKAEGAKVERERIFAILNHEHAEGRAEQAKVLALETDMNAEQAGKVLAVTPVAAPAQAGGPSANPFLAAMAAVANPQINAAGVEEGGENDSDEAEVGRVVALVPSRLRG